MIAGADRYERLASAGPMQIASSASIGASDSRSASRVGDDRLDAERAAGAQDAQRDLAPVRDEDPADHAQPSPAGPPGRRPPRAHGASASMAPISSPYSTASPACTKTSTSVPSIGRRDVLGDAEEVDDRDPVAGADGRPDRDAGPEDADRGRGGDGPIRVRASAVAAALAAARLRVRAPPGRRAGRRSLRGAGRRRRRAERAPDADPPVALADLHLAEAGAGQLRDERGHERLREAREARVVGLSLGGGVRSAGCWGSGMG